MIDTSETIRVMNSTGKKIISKISSTSGLTTRMIPSEVSTPLPPLNPKKTGYR